MGERNEVGYRISSWQRVVALYHAIVSRPARKAFDTWAERPAIDLLLALTLLGMHLIIVYRYHMGNVLAWAEASQRTDTYAAGAGITALIGGFAGVAIAQYGSSSGPLVTLLRATHGARIRKNWLSITKWLMTAAALSVISMAIDGGSTPRGSAWVFEFAFLIALLKFSRLLFLFEMIMMATDRQDKETLAAEEASDSTKSRRSRNPARVPRDTGIDFGGQDW